MKYSNKRHAQEVLVSLKKYGVKQIVISPGSRNAPLTISFCNDNDFETFSVVDERAAAFFALGLIQQSGSPVAVCCTSGSALLNYYPAVAEAFYSKLPLIVISADRPPHLIDVGDGQTIRQKRVFDNHIESFLHVDPNRSAIKAINKLIYKSVKSSGPVHLNIPFDEPLYETQEEMSKEVIESAERLFREIKTEPKLLSEKKLDKLSGIWNQSSRKIVLIGANRPSLLLNEQIQKLLQDPSVLVLCESLSNISHPRLINQIDQLISDFDESTIEKLRPDILLTFGGLIVSKRIKQLFRKYPPLSHWHVDLRNAPDTYFCLSKHIKMDIELFFSQFFWLTKPLDSRYQDYWIEKRDEKRVLHEKYIKDMDYSDFSVFREVFNNIPNNTMLQLANSSVVRYVQLFDWKKGIYSFANRGTSGIDGSTSTAVGATHNTTQENSLFISGDTSFFYDANGLWNNYIPRNLKIIVINNNGGGIFRIIDGPKQSGALSFFETPHNRSVKGLCELHNLHYTSVEKEEGLKPAITKFFNSNEDKPMVLEIFTPSEQNDMVLKDYFKNIKISYGGI